MKYFKRYFILLPITVLFVGVAIGVYLWQNNKVTLLEGKIVTQTKTNKQLKNQVSNLTNQINSANKAITNLTTHISFIAGSPCQTDQLNLSTVPNYGGGYAGGYGILFSYQNVSSSECTIKGYPGFLALSSTGYVIPDGPINTGAVFNDRGPTLLNLSSGDKAYFMVRGPDSTGNPKNACIEVALIESTPPGGSIPIVITTPNNFTICEGLSISALAPYSNFQ